MKARLKYILSFFVIIVAFFMLAKVAFMLYNSEGQHFGVGDVFSVLWHGLPLDFSMGGYITVAAWAVCVLSIFVPGKWTHTATKVCAFVIAPLLSLMIVADIVVYSFWQSKLDATVFNYIDSPKEMVASVSAGYVTAGVLSVVAVAALLLFALRVVWRMDLTPVRNRLKCTAWLVALAGLMFVMIRGGVGRSTMNIGYVYYSQNQFLNHSAVNPVFNLLSSSLKMRNYDKMYRFYEPAKCDSIFAQLHYDSRSIDSDTLLRTTRPDIVMVVMEGCGSVFMKPAITPNLCRLAEEGVYFSQCYANSFRTDRGLVSVLSGYPAFPDLSVMKIPGKSENLPSIARTLSANGYATDFLYGGDINFTNTKSYLLSTGYRKASGYETFPLSVHHTHSWGVQDHITLDTLYNKVACGQRRGERAHDNGQRSMITCLTLSSHEDWQVPYHRIKGDTIANAMAYLDNCIGRFVSRLKATPEWKDLLLIITADHGITYPADITEANPDRNRIPVIWAGGAVRSPRRIETLCNQTDLAATLLGQLALPHGEFTFSRDVLSRTYTYPCAIHTFIGGITFIDSTGYVVEDLKAQHIISSERRGNSSEFNARRSVKKAHAYLQKTIQDFAKR